MHSPAHIQKASDSVSSRVRKRPVIQADLEIGQPGDKYEQEADAVAQRVMMQPSMDEEEAVQMQPAAEEEELQMQAVEEEELQMQAFGEEEELQMEQMDGEEEMLQMADEEEEFLQAKPMVQAIDGGGMKASPELASKISSTQGTGSPLEPGIQREMGGKMGADFSGVNIHTGSDASAMSSEIGARAFTVGNDIYFNKGQYDPHSSSGKHLLAHELTHTVQQGAVRRKMIQRDEDEPVVDPPEGVRPISESGGEFSFHDADGTTIFNSSGKELMLPILSLPSFKSRNSNLIHPPFVLERGREIIPTLDELTAETRKQRDIWNSFIENQASRNLNEKLSEARISGGYSRNENETERVYFFKGKKNERFNVFGTEDHLLEVAKIPTWDENEIPTSLQVDHVMETQLGGANRVSNYELLEASANGSSGSSIMWEMNRRVKRAHDVLSHEYYNHDSRTEKPTLPSRPPLLQQYVNSYVKDNGISINFLSNEFSLPTGSGAPDRFWNFNSISRGEHLDKLEALSGDEMRELGTEDDPALFISATGGDRLQVPTDEDQEIVEWLPRVNLKGRPDFENLTLRVDAYKAKDAGAIDATYPDMTWYLNTIPGIYGFHVDKQRTMNEALSGQGVFQSLRLPGLSPIQIEELDIVPGKGFVGRGKVLPTVPVIRDADIELIIEGAEFRLRKLFDMEEINVPSPFRVYNSSLEVFFSNQRGLGVEGETEFGIDHVGEGHVGAAASTSGGFELEGAFNFDSELFDPASIEVEYKDETWTIGGQIGIPEGKVRGVKSATINATYSEGNFAATGEAELDIPGIERGTMEVNYGEEGFSIGGAFDLSSDIPGIQSGRVEATVSKESGDEEYSVSVAGTARPDIPGVDSTLSIAYNDGAITIEGTADYSRGMLSGTVRLGATNRAIDDNGQPEGEPDDTMRVYGGGSLTLQLTPWLEATAGVTFLPNGEMEVQGRIGLPGTVDVFPRRQIRRNLFTVPTIEIPLFAIPLGPRSIGLVAQIGGGLDFEAGFGPGQLRELYAEVTYNPDREDETTLHGRGVFAIPADAGLTLRGDLGLGVSVAIASLSGGIELAGTLGLEGEALASVDVNWSPQTGIALDAEGRVTVNPKFAFNLNAFARATLGIGWFSVSETWRHRLAGFEWGPDIQFGIVFPVHYREGEPFDLSFDDIEVIYPELDIPNMAKGLARDVKDDLF